MRCYFSFVKYSYLVKFILGEFGECFIVLKVVFLEERVDLFFIFMFLREKW